MKNLKPGECTLSLIYMQETVLHLVIMTIAFTLYSDWSTALIEAARNCMYISSHNKEGTNYTLLVLQYSPVQ